MQRVYGADAFPVEGFAKWMKMPVEQATSLCIELANNGFLFYDRNFNEVVIKKKVDDYIASFAKKKDYDAITINSEARDEEENAILDLKTFDLSLAGCKQSYHSVTLRRCQSSHTTAAWWLGKTVPCHLTVL